MTEIQEKAAKLICPVHGAGITVEGGRGYITFSDACCGRLLALVEEAFDLKPGRLFGRVVADLAKRGPTMSIRLGPVEVPDSSRITVTVFNREGEISAQGMADFCSYCGHGCRNLDDMEPDRHGDECLWRQAIYLVILTTSFWRRKREVERGNEPLSEAELKEFENEFGYSLLEFGVVEPDGDGGQRFRMRLAEKAP